MANDGADKRDGWWIWRDGWGLPASLLVAQQEAVDPADDETQQALIEETAKKLAVVPAGMETFLVRSRPSARQIKKRNFRAPSTVYLPWYDSALSSCALSTRRAVGGAWLLDRQSHRPLQPAKKRAARV